MMLQLRDLMGLSPLQYNLRENAQKEFESYATFYLYLNNNNVYQSILEKNASMINLQREFIYFVYYSFLVL